MRSVLYVATLLLLPFQLWAQSPGCSCSQALGKLITKVEEEYPGFSAKTQDTSLYRSFKRTLYTQAQAPQQEDCPRILKTYTDYFKDPHLWVGAHKAPFSAAVGESTEKITFELPEFERQLQTTRDSLEGIYTAEGYTFGVKRINSDEYVGFIIKASSPAWQPKDVKFRLFSNHTFSYALSDRSIKKGRYQCYSETIIFLDAIHMALTRQLPKGRLNETQIKNQLQELEGFYVKKLSEKTALLKLPSFEYQHVATINTLLEQQKSILETSENLIIDIRGNPGGTTDAYARLLPYLLGKEIRHTGVEFLATQTYISNLERYRKSLDPQASTTGLDQQIKTLKAHLGTFVNFNAADQPVFIEKVKGAHKSPRRIVILANKGTGSSAEYFLFIAKQSSKVKVLGTPSYGALDYGNAYLIDFDCPPYELFMPTYRALRLPDYPIDTIGLQPDVYMDASIADWIAFAVTYVES